MPRDELRTWVDYARRHGAVILYDAAYEAYIRDPDVPHSIFEIEGARECAIEFRSFSKTAGFTGTRCAFTVVPKELQGRTASGQPSSLHALWFRRQSTKFNGVPYVVQRGAAASYTDEGRKEVRAAVDFYMENARIIRDGLRAAGFQVYGGENAPYIWVKTPPGLGSWDLFDRLLTEAHVVGTPGRRLRAERRGLLPLHRLRPPRPDRGSRRADPHPPPAVGGVRPRGPPRAMAVQALTFDTYGTVVDWRDSVLAQLVEFGAARGLDVDWTAFLTEWKAGYRPGMDRVNSGEWPWTTVETIYRRRLEELLPRHEHRGPRRGRPHPPDPGLVAPPPLARRRPRPPAPPRAVRPLPALERELRRHGAPRAVRRAPVGLHHHRRERALLQAAARGLPDGRRAPRPPPGRGHDGRGPQLRPRRGARAAGSARRSSPARPSTGPGQTSDLAPEADWDVVAADFLDLARQLDA